MLGSFPVNLVYLVTLGFALLGVKLLRTSAEIPIGLTRAFDDYEKKNEAASRRV
jgi:hypothetical protein